MRTGTSIGMEATAAAAATADEDKTIFDSIAGAVIDEDARQKYVLIEVKFNGRERHLVRGRHYAAYHKDAAEPTLAELQRSNLAGLAYRVLGGGRIVHSSETKTILVFGFSYGFPWEGEPQHADAAAVIEKAFPGFAVTVSDEGY